MSPQGAEASPGGPRRRHLVLVGMMGAGKTTVGRALAARLGQEHRDLDAEVAKAAGRGVPDIIEEQGEPAFRRIESQVLRQVLGHPGPLVVSVGGGAVLEEGNREVLAVSGTVVWLRATPATLAARVGDGAGRPLLADGPDALARLESSRRPLYAQVADLTIDVDDLEAQEVARRIEQASARREANR